MPQVTVKELDADAMLDALEALADVLHATVHDGASVGFILPFSKDDSRAFWRDRIHGTLTTGTRVLLVALVEGRVVGTVQLDTDTMPNQTHRAEVSKLLVHPGFRRRGIARTLMAELEQRARNRRRRLLTLDTRTGDDAEPLYRSLGFETAGVIPGYCRAVERDVYDSTTYMYKSLN